MTDNHAQTSNTCWRSPPTDGDPSSAPFSITPHFIRSDINALGDRAVPGESSEHFTPALLVHPHLGLKSDSRQIPEMTPCRSPSSAPCIGGRCSHYGENVKEKAAPGTWNACPCHLAFFKPRFLFVRPIDPPRPRGRTPIASRENREKKKRKINNRREKIDLTLYIASRLWGQSN